ncbi:MAG: alpha/beta fold hydrolase [Bdellovibrionales bacterium]
MFYAAAQASMGDLQLWLKGVEAYQQAPHPAPPSSPKVIWEQGAARVLDYTQVEGDTLLLVVPSHINRSTILDLLPHNSFMRALAEQFPAWLLDWGLPGTSEKEFTFDDYITTYVVPVIAQARRKYKRVVLLGYCMGGLSALAAAALEKVDALILMATPWDFYAYPVPTRLGLANMTASYQPWINQGNALTVDMIQTLFSLMQPMAVFEKFKKAGKDGCDELFVAIEDWLNGGIELPAHVAQTCLIDWFQNNATYRGSWSVDGTIVKPEGINVPALVVLPERDQVVPLRAAQPLVDFLPQGEPLPVPLGHVGMIVGRQSASLVREPILAWLRGQFS